ncbi:MAG: transcription termination/antitermination factor NusG [Candidatus Levybacteria bacterium]|nr:transcription termination/antitermination factor NusG [Candidatus Levybacteria bacterium]
MDDPNQKNQTDQETDEVLDDASQTATESPQQPEQSPPGQSPSGAAPKQPQKEQADKPVISVSANDSPSAFDAAKWYIVHTYSGHENKVTKSIKQRVASLGFENRIFDIIVPTRNTIKVSQGKKETVKEKIFPGYVLVKMILDDESWLLVRTTQGVTAFIGAGNKPTPISEKEVEAIQKFMNAEEPLYKTAYTIGEAVKIVDGPFSDFLGTIDDIDEARGKLKVLVSIFGRETPVELDFLQVNKL